MTSSPAWRVEYEQRMEQRRQEWRETLGRMSDQAIRYQLLRGAQGGIQQEEIVQEARCRGIV